MSLQPITPTPEAWDAFVESHPRAHLLQTSAWGELKAAFGWTPARIALADSGGTIVAGVQFLMRQFPYKVGWLAYAPYGPLVDWSDAPLVNTLMKAVDRAVKKHHGGFLKIEPGFGLRDVDFAAYGFRPSPQTVQPPRTVRIDLNGSDDEILERMNQGTRRNIRKSAKYEVTIREGTRADVASFNALLDETGDRDDFGTHAPEYYEKAYDLFVPQGRAALILGSHAGQDLAGVMVFTLGDEAWYLYGASSQQERQRMASYAVQWAGIQWAKVRGVKVYDMYGVPDENYDTLETQFETRDDNLWGVYRFKRGWGGTVTRSVGAWDRAYNRVVYGLYRYAVRQSE